MVHELSRFINQNQLFSKSDRILVGLSGGVDSMVLSHLLFQLGYEFAIAHVNFGLRGYESDQDEEFVRKFAISHSITAHFYKCNEHDFNKVSGESIQMAARRIRYDYFQQLCSNEGYNVVALAQHKNDLVETVLINLSRGGGIASFHGILPKNNNLVRPLWFATKEKVLEYAYQNQLEWREDSSNSSVKYDRNLIRQQIIPELKKLNPSIEHTVARTAKRISKTEQSWLYLAKKLLNEHIKSIPFGCYTLPFEAIPEALDAAPFLEVLFEKYDFSYQQIEEMASWRFEGQSGIMAETSTLQVCLNRNSWVWKPKFIHTPTLLLQANTQYDIGWSTIKTTIVNTSSQPSTDPFCLWIDYTPNQKLILRTFESGDKIKISGMNGTKKVSDLLTDYKVPLIAKKVVPILTKDSEIIWVAGIRKSSHCEQLTSELLQIQIIPKPSLFDF